MPRLAADPSLFNTRLDMLVRHETPDGQGGISLTWEAAGSVWGIVASLNLGSRTEVPNGDMVTTLITLRRSRLVATTLSSGARLSAPGRLWQVISFGDPDGRAQWLQCYCGEIDP